MAPLLFQFPCGLVKTREARVRNEMITQRRMVVGQNLIDPFISLEEGGIARIQTILSRGLVIHGFCQLCYGLVQEIARAEFPNFDAGFGNNDRPKGVELLG
ncbi:hypothetical protein CEXT_316411 [Caerostris extrusa]|uniref:Uncharacterized protein n=1 Tax=Caerostris extrusa TaxID=172846 RepID=A0AAV4VM94_CAEEX|nr:hypothetical protein CEXT_316411 [Caerostris extrusa]